MKDLPYEKFLVNRPYWGLSRDNYLFKLIETVNYRYHPLVYWQYTPLSWEARRFTFNEVFKIFDGQLTNLKHFKILGLDNLGLIHDIETREVVGLS